MTEVVEIPIRRLGGRPRFEIDYVLAERMSMLQCTIKEIAAVMGCSHDVLDRDERFSVIHKFGMENGKASLRRLQWKGANAGNPAMLIWLGKQYLGQRDKSEVEAEVRLREEPIDTIEAARRICFVLASANAQTVEIVP